MTASVIALIAAAGHISGDMVLATWSDGRLIDMKQTTVAMMLCAGVMAVLMTTAPASRWRETAIGTLASAVAGMLFTQAFWYSRVTLIDHDLTPVIFSSMQSIGTLIGLTLLAVSGWLRAVFENVWAAIAMSRIAGVLGVGALLGYAVGVPQLYWSFPGISNPMAIPTAVCLVLCAFAVNGRETI